MKIVVIGGGPAGLYFSILMKKLDPAHDIEVYERNKADDTFGWGIVFSDETLDNIAAADAQTYQQITDRFANWKDIDIFYHGERVRSTGHGFCGMSRKVFLNVLQTRAQSLGVRIVYQKDVSDLDQFTGADLIVAADGVNSAIREQYAAHFKPSIDWRKCRFSWLGTSKPFDAFTFYFHESEHGLFQIHAYRFEPGASTFIAECHEDVWRRAGLDKASETETVAYLEKLFVDELDGHRLLTNRSVWRSFPTIRNEHWHYRNIVLLGDALHTAHFSIGSGTKLAMEDAIALRAVFERVGCRDVPAALAAFQQERETEVIRTQKAAQTSLEWFENSARYLRHEPRQFAFSLLTRSKRITYDNLKLRDPALVKDVTDWFGRTQGPQPVSDGRPPMFVPFRLRGMELVNRVVVSPMCMYSADDGTANDWHVVHLGSRAVGGAGLVVAEMTAVSRDARISPGCTGIYKPEHVAAWRRITDFVHQRSQAKIALQLGHAGRKGSTKVPWEGMDDPLDSGNWPLISASAIPYTPANQTPKAMDRGDMDRVRDDFVRAARMADEAGFDMLELHMAHGYLLASFISPLTNTRKDEYGGSVAGRMRFPLEIFDAVRAAWPKDKPISVRISAVDWADGGQTAQDSVEAARLLKAHGCDIIDVSTGQTVAWQKPNYGRMFQAPFSEKIRLEAGIPTMTVGAVQNADHCNTILAGGRADLCVLARPHLKDPYFTLHAAEQYGFKDQHWPNQYTAVKPQ